MAGKSDRKFRIEVNSRSVKESKKHPRRGHWNSIQIAGVPEGMCNWI